MFCSRSDYDYPPNRLRCLSRGGTSLGMNTTGGMQVYRRGGVNGQICPTDFGGRSLISHGRRGGDRRGGSRTGGSSRLNDLPMLQRRRDSVVGLLGGIGGMNFGDERDIRGSPMMPLGPFGSTGGSPLLGRRDAIFDDDLLSHHRSPFLRGGLGLQGLGLRERLGGGSARFSDGLGSLGSRSRQGLHSSASSLDLLRADRRIMPLGAPNRGFPHYRQPYVEEDYDSELEEELQMQELAEYLESRDGMDASHWNGEYMHGTNLEI